MLHSNKNSNTMNIVGITYGILLSFLQQMLLSFRIITMYTNVYTEDPKMQ